MKIFSFDAETNGLYGDAFAISAIVYSDGNETDRFVAYLGADGVTDSWVQDNVLPKLGDLEVTHDSYEEMLADFIAFYSSHKDGADVIAHMACPVEAKLFIDAFKLGIMGMFDGPFPLVDVSAVLKAKGYDPTSVDKYSEQFDLMNGRSEAEGLESHHPLYDSVVAAVVYMHLMQ